MGLIHPSRGSFWNPLTNHFQHGGDNSFFLLLGIPWPINCVSSCQVAWFLKSVITSVFPSGLLLVLLCMVVTLPLWVLALTYPTLSSGLFWAPLRCSCSNIRIICIWITSTSMPLTSRWYSVMSWTIGRLFAGLHYTSSWRRQGDLEWQWPCLDRCTDSWERLEKVINWTPSETTLYDLERRGTECQAFLHLELYSTRCTCA